MTNRYDEVEVHVTLKDGPLRQVATPKEYVQTNQFGEAQSTSREQAHLNLVREATNKAREGFDPYKVRSRPGIVWGRILNVFRGPSVGSKLALPGNAKATVRHWIETPDGRRLIFEYARGQLIRCGDEEWLAVHEEFILAEQLDAGDECQLIMLNHSVLVQVDPLPDHTGILYDPSARQVQAETGTVLAHACPELGLQDEERIAFIATAGTYCVINDVELRIIHRDQILGVLERPVDPGHDEFEEGTSWA